jgi:hypothetical protein
MMRATVRAGTSETCFDLGTTRRLSG